MENKYPVAIYFMLNNYQEEIANITPKELIKIFKNNPVLQAKLVLEKFLGLWIYASGKINSIDDWGSNYITINFHNKSDGVYVSANFDKPLEKNLILLNKNDVVWLVGKIFNVAEKIVVLDHCKVIKKFNFSIETKNDKKESFVHNKHKLRWYTNHKNVMWIFASVLVPLIVAYIGSSSKSSIINTNSGDGDIVAGDKEINQTSIDGGDNIVGDKIIYESQIKKLRALDILETGKKVSELPTGVYFFSDAIDIATHVRYVDTHPFPYEFQIEGTNIKRDKDYQVQKTDNGVVIVGYINSENFSKLNFLSKNNPLSMIIFPTIWSGYQKLVGIPITAVSKIDSRRIDIDATSSIYILDLTSSEVISDVVYYE